MMTKVSIFYLAARRCRQLWFWIIVLAAIPCAAVEIPTGLTTSDLPEVIDTLGVETSAKFLSNPYPLGGYSGFEVGLSSELVNTRDLSRLGDGAKQENTFQFNRISFGKGLYQNFDIFIHFVPFSASNEISEYGGALKYTFYEAQRLPLTVSILGHASTFNFDDKFTNEALGWDLMSGMNLRRFAVYFGGGGLQTRSTFSETLLDPSVPINSTGTLVVQSRRPHSFVGLHINWGPIFFAAQIDRYQSPVYGGKIGLRF